MLDSCTIEERWSGVDSMIERWLQERQDLIVQYCAISGVHEFSPKSPTSNARLEHFCGLLVDYVSAGHFEIYYQLIREAEAFDDGSAELAQSIFPYLHSSTEAALDFNDSFSKIDTDKPVTTLSKGLSSLGETLASRFELEDRLIELHKAHEDLISA